MGTAPLIRACRFGPYELNLRTGDLRKNGRHIRLQEKTRNLLIALVEQPGEIVTRAELRERLWPQDTFVDFEDGLNTAMRKLRESLSDTYQSPRFIETLRGRGYRFIATVELIPAGEDAAPDGNENDLPTSPAGDDETNRTGSRALHWRTTIITILATSAVLAMLAFFAVRWRTSRPQRVSIAVLPLANMTGDASRNYLSNGITEELIVRLGQMGPDRLRVIAPTSAKTYGGTSKNVAEIGRELDVQYVIEGSLQQQGAVIRVVTQLVRTNDGARLWANSYDGDLGNLFELENNVADSVAHALTLKEPSLPSPGYMPARVEAHDAYLQGLYSLSERSRSGFAQALNSFGQAVAIDPKYAAAYAELAVTYDLMGQYNWMSSENARNLGYAAAEQALSLDPEQAEAHASLGFSLWFYRWDGAAAEQEFRKAIALSPQNVDAHHWYAQLLMTDGRFDEAETQMQAALRLDPRSPILRTNLGWLYYFEGRNAQAIQELQDVIRTNPDFVTAHYKLWYAYSVAGDEGRAWPEFYWVYRWSSTSALKEQIAKAHQKDGIASAMKVFVAASNSDTEGSTVDGARCMMFAHDDAAALQLLERALDAHEGWLIFAAFDPAFSKLRNDARFKSVMSSVTRERMAEHR